MGAIFQKDQRVVVAGPGNYNGRYTGCTGVVYSVYGQSSIGVRLDGVQNAASKYSVFYFHASDLRHEKQTEIKEDEGRMQKITDFVNVADVQFLDDKTPFRTYEYANFDPTLAAGDLCVVKSAHHGMGLAEIVDIKQKPAEDLYREIVCKVDTTDFLARVERREKAAEIKARMQERAKQLQDIVLYQTLAKDDPEMQVLLNEFLSLNRT